MNKTLHRMSLPVPGVRLRESAEGEAPSRTIEGYAIRFNTPSEPLWDDDEEEVREVIAPEAVTRELLDGSDIKLTMFHDRQLILGRSNKGKGTLSYEIDDEGVRFSVELPKSPNGDEALSAVSRGDISGCSFAFSAYYGDRSCVAKDTETRDGKAYTTYTVRSIIGVYDFTLAADPAYPSTSVGVREMREMLQSPRPGAETEDGGKREKVARLVKTLRAEAKKRLL